MSYCRWSSEDYWSDIDCHKGFSGIYIIHVSPSRIIGDIPKMPPFGSVSNEEYLAASKSQKEFIKNADSKPIGLPMDGKIIYSIRPGLCADELMNLMHMGYHVPQQAINDLYEEQKELDDAEASK